MKDLPTRRLFLIGSEASKAMSPVLWNPVLDEVGAGWIYEAWDVPGGQHMAGVRRGLLQPDVVAANVTMPHKRWAAGTADEVTEQVRLSGAANLLVRRGETLFAHNTDISAVEERLAGEHQRHALMLGAGGAARAAVVALRGNVDRITVTDRDPNASQQLVALAAGLGIAASTASWGEAQDQASEASLIVNATPIGKNLDDPPAWGSARLDPGALVYDFVYSDHVTATISMARTQGVECTDGWDHLHAQAAAMIPLLGLPLRTHALLHQALSHVHMQA
jgi:shikimate dehydrogenase